MELTHGETALIDRLRLGQTQGEAGYRFGVTMENYREKELDTGICKSPHVFPLQPHEQCLLYRRRAGKNHTEVAKEIGCSKKKISRMENGIVPCDDLLKYWEGDE